MSNIRDDPTIKGARGAKKPPLVDHNQPRHIKASLDLSKASPSNGQCPTAVSSRHQTIPSREVQPQQQNSTRGQSQGSSTAKTFVRERDAISAVHTQQRNKVAYPLGSLSQNQKRGAQYVSRDGQRDHNKDGNAHSKQPLTKQYTFKEASEEHKDSFNSLDESEVDRVANERQATERDKMKPPRIKAMASDEFQAADQTAASARNHSQGEDNLRKMRQSNQDCETVSYKLKMQNNAGGASLGTEKLHKQKPNVSTRTMLPSSNKINKNAIIDTNNTQSPHDQLMTTSRSKNNQSPQIEESIGRVIQISNVRPPSFDTQSNQINSLDAGPSHGDDSYYTGDFMAQQAPRQIHQMPQSRQERHEKNPRRHEETSSEYNPTMDDNTQQQQYLEMHQITTMRGTRDESPRTNKEQQHMLRHQQQRLSQPDRLNAQGNRHDVPSKQASPKQNTRSFIIRNTTQNYSVPTQPENHQPKVLPPVRHGNTKAGKTPVIISTAPGKSSGIAGVSKRSSPIGVETKEGNIRRLSQNQNSINMYLEQESKFDSTKDASEFGGGGGHGTSSLVKDYASSLPDSIKVKGAAQDRSYDEAWQVDHGSSTSCQHGEGSCDQRLDSAQTSLLNKRRPSANRFNQEFFDQSVQRSEDQNMQEQAPTPIQAPISGKSKKHMQLTQPRTKDYARKANQMRGKLQSQNQNRFVDEVEDEYVQQVQGRVKVESRGGGKNNYHSPVQLREIGLSQQMVPNQMKQQLKQRKTVYGQSFFSSPPNPSQQQFMNSETMDGGPHQHMPPAEKTRNTQLDSSLRRKRQLPVPSSSQQPSHPTNQSAKQQSHQHQQQQQFNPGVKKLSSNQEVIPTRNSMQQSFPLQLTQHVPMPHPPQSQQRKTLQRHIESAAQHIEFDERQQNEGKISQLSRFNVYQAGMRNVLTAGENSPRVIDHFPATRASRWKGNAQMHGGGAVYDMMQMDFDGQQMHDPGSQHLQRNQFLPSHDDPRGGQGLRSGGPPPQFHNSKKLPKRSGTASYITTGGIPITINRDNKHLNGANLTTHTEENMNLMLYDWNNASVIPEETQRNLLRSQTTDRGPSRKLRSRGRFKLASSNQQKRGNVDSAGFGEIRPFQVSTEFEMGMYPPGCGPMTEEDMGIKPPSQGLPLDHPNAMTLQNSPDGKRGHERNSFGQGVNSKNGNRNIQSKRLSSQTHIQRSSQGVVEEEHHGGGTNSIISSNKADENQETSQSPSNMKSATLAQVQGHRRVQKKYYVESSSIQSMDSSSAQQVRQKDGNCPSISAASINRALPKKNFAAGQGVGQRGELFRNYSREGSRGGERAQKNNQHHAPMPAAKPLSRIPQHRQTNLANVMESIREEDPHL